MVSVSDNLYDYSVSRYKHTISRSIVPYRSPIAYVNMVNGEFETLEDLQIWALCKMSLKNIRLFYRGPRSYRRRRNPHSCTLKADAWGAAIYAV